MLACSLAEIPVCVCVGTNPNTKSKCIPDCCVYCQLELDRLVFLLCGIETVIIVNFYARVNEDLQTVMHNLLF